MFSIAVNVSVGAVPPGGVAEANRLVHAPTPPVVFTHAAIMFASVLIVLSDTIPFPAGVTASATPEVTLARLAAVVKAFTSPVTFVLLVPTALLPGVIKPESAYTAATDVTSFRMTNVPGPMLPQLPSAAIRTDFGFTPEPVFPPTDTRYVDAEAVGHVKLFAMLNEPVASVNT